MKINYEGQGLSEESEDELFKMDNWLVRFWDLWHFFGTSFLIFNPSTNVTPLTNKKS